jgi:hypothetical protein
MFQKKEGDVEKSPEKDVIDLGDERRSPLVMIPKNNDFDPQFPAMFYRKGKYATL